MSKYTIVFALAIIAAVICGILALNAVTSQDGFWTFNFVMSVFLAGILAVLIRRAEGRVVEHIISVTTGWTIGGVGALVVWGAIIPLLRAAF